MLNIITNVSKIFKFKSKNNYSKYLSSNKNIIKMDSNRRNTNKRKERSQGSRSRSISRSVSRNKSKSKKEKLTEKDKYGMKKNTEQYQSYEEYFNYQRFKEQDDDFYEQIMKIPGLRIVETEMNENEFAYARYVIEQPEALSHIPDCDPSIIMAPSLFLQPELIAYQYDVHQEYYGMYSNQLRENPNIIINAVYNVNNIPNNLNLPFRSAQVFTLHLINRLHSDFNPPNFNNIPRGTLLGEFSIRYRARGGHLILGPTPYFR
jgi:hypothetical protein